MGRRVLYILLIALLAPQIIFAGGAPGETPDPSVRLLVGRSTIVDVGTPIARVSLTSADVADALVTAPNQLLINGKTPGTISMFVWDRGGALRRYEVTVERDVVRLTDQVRQLFPGEKINIESNGRNIVLSGSVSTKDISEKALNLAAGYTDKKEEVINLMQVAEGGASNQVLLRVRFAEVSRSALTQLGASFFTSPTGVKNTIGRITTGQYPSVGYDQLQWTQQDGSFGSPVTSASGKFTFSDFLNLFLFNEKYDIGTMVQALQTKGLFQSLAEPNLVAESGKEASFLAGGEIPVPVAQPSASGIAITIVWKEFGIRLKFTPIVNGNRVHLKVNPEVSSLDFNNAIVLQGFRIPALNTRKTETELELQDHQTFAIAGLLSNSMLNSMQKVPGFGDIPILGLLFKSKAAQKDQTELVVMITPEILRTNSVGVTDKLPRLQEPYLPPLPDKKSFATPPPAFVPPSGQLAPSAAAVAAAAAADLQAKQEQQRKDAAAAKPDPAAAAAAVTALTPRGPQVANPQPAPQVAQPTSQVAQPQSTPQVTAQQPAATVAPSASPVSRPLTADERKAFQRARALEEKQAQAAKEAEAKRMAKQQEADQKAAAEQKKRDEKAAKEQAKRDAEAQKRAAEEAKRQAERDKVAQKQVDEAAAKLKAAQAAYDAELAKKQQQKQ